jgi:protoporphyrinogen oxidase
VRNPPDLPVAVIGGGFAGLSAAYELGQRGIPCTVFERDADVGGLAGSFTVDGADLEKFYHHWFTSDEHVMGLVSELGLADRLVRHASRTGMYYANRHYRLSTPVDLLRFDPLPFLDRIRLGLMTLKVRRIDDWRALEGLTAAEWAREVGGERAYEVVWEPLLRGKFGAYAERVSAVWLWNKLKLRGGSRRSDGSEELVYLRGGFAGLARTLAQRIEAAGGHIVLGAEVEGIEQEAGWVGAVLAGGERHPVSHVIATTALPELAAVVRDHVEADVVADLERIEYLGNVCIVLELDRSLSSTYWLNVNDLSFPFVGVIEHTNMEPTSAYGGRHIVYLSRYLSPSDPLYAMDEPEALAYSLRHLKQMFPELHDDWVLGGHAWRARYSQPIVECHYSDLLERVRLPFDNVTIASMAQIYPEDRGTNYAVREGRAAAARVAATR